MPATIARMAIDPRLGRLILWAAGWVGGAAAVVRGDVLDHVPPDAVVVFQPAAGVPARPATRPALSGRFPLADLERRWGVPARAVDPYRAAAAVVPADGSAAVLVLPVADYADFVARLHGVRTSTGTSVLGPDGRRTFVADWGDRYAALARRRDLLGLRHDGLVLTGPDGRRCHSLPLANGLLVVRPRADPATRPAAGPALLAGSDPAVDALDRLARTLDPTAAPADRWADVGSVLSAAGEWPAAEALFRRAVAAAPGVADLHVRLASAVLSQGDYAGGAAQLQEAVRLDPRNFDAFHLGGQALVLVGDFPRAAGMLAEAVRLRPDSAVARSDLAVALIRCGRDAEAEAQLRRALALRPDLAAARTNLAVLQRRAATRAATRPAN